MWHFRWYERREYLFKTVSRLLIEFDYFLLVAYAPNIEHHIRALGATVVSLREHLMQLARSQGQTWLEDAVLQHLWDIKYPLDQMKRMCDDNVRPEIIRLENELTSVITAIPPHLLHELPISFGPGNPDGLGRSGLV